MTPAANILNLLAKEGGQMKISEIVKRSPYGSAIARDIIRNAMDDNRVERVKRDGFVHYRITELGRAYVWHHLGE